LRHQGFSQRVLFHLSPRPPLARPFLDVARAPALAIVALPRRARGTLRSWLHGALSHHASRLLRLARLLAVHPGDGRATVEVALRLAVSAVRQARPLQAPE